MRIYSLIPLILLIAASAFFTSCSTDKDPAGHPARPNIILLMADDMGYECLSSNGCLSYSTPVLDELTWKEKRIKNAFQAELNTAPPHHFKQPEEY